MEPLSKGCPIAARVDASSLMVPACTSAWSGRGGSATVSGRRGGWRIPGATRGFPRGSVRP